MPNKKKKQPKQPDPSMVGTGMANKAAKALRGRAAQIDAIVSGTRKRKDEKEKKGRR